MPTLAPGAVWRPVHASTRVRVRPELGLVQHCQQGNGSPFGWFDRPGSDASSTWWISKRGVLEQYVDPDVARAWAQGAGNGSYHSVEFEGWVGETLTPAQLATAATLYAWGAEHRGWALTLAEAPGQRGFGWHGMGTRQGWGHPDCPGPLRRAQRGDILTRAGLLLRPLPGRLTPDTKSSTDPLEDLVASLTPQEKDELMRAVGAINRTFDTKIQSLVNPQNSYWVPELLQFIDRATNALAKKAGV